MVVTIFLKMSDYAPRMKSNPDTCKRNSTTRNVSEFIAQVVRESPLHEKDLSYRKRVRTAPLAVAVGTTCNSTFEMRRDGNKLGKQMNNRHSMKLFTTKPHRKQDDISEILPRLKRLTSQECSRTPNKKSVFSFVKEQINKSRCQIDSSLETSFPIPPPVYPKPTSTRLNLSYRSDIHSTSISEYIGRVIEKSPKKLNRTLRTSKGSVGDWLKSAVDTTSPPQDRDVGGLQRRKRNKKLVSEGFAEYVRIISRRLANDAHLWYHSIKREVHLEGVESSAIITACIGSIRSHGSLYIMLCTLNDPVPDNIADNDHYRTNGKITILFSHQTVEMLRITQKSCVKICPPWTFLPIGEFSSPVILCTYFSFLCESASQDTGKLMQTDQLNKITSITSLWRSVGSQDVDHALPSSVQVSDESTMDAELCLRDNSLASVLRSQRWEDLTLAGSVVHVTHSVNSQITYGSDSVEMQYFHTFVQDTNGHLSLLTLPECILDKFPTLQVPHQLMNNSVIFNSVRMVSRVNKLTSPHVMSVVQTLSDQNQRYCYCFAANSNVRLNIFSQPIRDTSMSRLAKLNSEEDFCSGKQRRVSLVGRLLHTQIETPQVSEEWETGENSRPISGAYIFLLGTNSMILQVYLDPILSQVTLGELNQSTGKLLYLCSLYRTLVTDRPSRMQGDQYSLLLQLDQAGEWLGRDLVGSVRNRFDQISPPPFPSFSRGYREWTLVRVKGRIMDVVEDSAYMRLVCDRCEEGVDEYSQSNELYCDECQRFVTHPIDKYKLDLMVECGVKDIQLIIQLNEATIKRIMPLLRTGKIYDKIDLEGKEIELEACFIQESTKLPTGITKVFLEEINQL